MGGMSEEQGQSVTMVFENALVSMKCIPLQCYSRGRRCSSVNGHVKCDCKQCRHSTRRAGDCTTQGGRLAETEKSHVAVRRDTAGNNVL